MHQFFNSVIQTCELLENFEEGIWTFSNGQFNGSIAEPRCTVGYQIATPNTTYQCNGGFWTPDVMVSEICVVNSTSTTTAESDAQDDSYILIITCLSVGSVFILVLLVACIITVSRRRR